MNLPIQAKPVSRNVSATKLTNVGIVMSAECCHCYGLLALGPQGIISSLACFVTCCGMNPGATCCSNMQGTGFGPGTPVGHRR